MLEIPAVNQNVFIDDVTYLFDNNTELCNLTLMPTPHDATMLWSLPFILLNHLSLLPSMYVNG